MLFISKAFKNYGCLTISEKNVNTDNFLFAFE